jgi:hypothetical protein
MKDPIRRILRVSSSKPIAVRESCHNNASELPFQRLNNARTPRFPKQTSQETPTRRIQPAPKVGTMPPSLPQFSAARARSYIFRLPLFTRCIILVIALLWLVSLQSAWDVQQWGALIPKEIGLATSSSPSLS